MIPVPSTTPKPAGIDAKILFARVCERAKTWYEVPENNNLFEEQKRREANAGRSQTVPTACCTEA